MLLNLTMKFLEKSISHHNYGVELFYILLEVYYVKTDEFNEFNDAL